MSDENDIFREARLQTYAAAAPPPSETPGKRDLLNLRVRVQVDVNTADADDLDEAVEEFESEVREAVQKMYRRNLFGLGVKVEVVVDKAFLGKYE